MAQWPVCPSLTRSCVMQPPQYCILLSNAPESGLEECQGGAHTRCVGPSSASFPVALAGRHCFFQGLCKLGSAGGTDFSMKQFAEGSTLKLAKQCRK